MRIDPILLDGRSELDREDVGGKAWAVNHMRRLGLPVPPAFALGTAVCRETLRRGRLPEAVSSVLRAGVAALEAETNRALGASENPLFLSVRSGAARSMPGMMDTLLNVGATPASLEAIARHHGARFAEDVRRRFARQFEEVVGAAPPADPHEQIRAAAEAVFRSWESSRARAYRAHHRLDGAPGTAVTVQAMVFGNLDDRSGTGVVFTRDVRSGTGGLVGEWLPCAQGEDVVSGTKPPLPLASLAAALPEAHRELMTAAEILERDAKDVQDVEFTIESGRLFLLQTRSAKRSPEAALRLAMTFFREGLIDRAEAVRRVAAEDVRHVVAPRLDPGDRRGARLLARGEPVCPGVASGVVVATAEEAEERADRGERVVLARPTTHPGDMRGMIAATAIVTEIGGATSHAAVVSRELGRTCVVGCGEGSLGSLLGRTVTVDGSTGVIFDGEIGGSCRRTVENDDDLALLASLLGAIDTKTLLEKLGES